MPDAVVTEPSRASLLAWVAACLRDEPQLPAVPLPLEAAEAEGVLPWIGWRLQESRLLSELGEERKANLRDSLRRWALMHLDCEAELERLAQTAADRGIRVIAFKGHSVARTLYPSPACRPTSDFDLLVDPAQVACAREWIASLGYTPLQPFVGTVWLGAQSWASAAAGNARFHADLHWDYSNRMYFRNRVPFETFWANSREVACGEATLRVPCPADDLVLACVHLAAHRQGMPVLLRWLLDIHLLMRAIGEADLPAFVAQAQQAHAVEACLEFGERAAALGEERQPWPALAALREAAGERRRRAYARTVQWRAWDLGAYWLRLPLRDKAAFFGDMARWVRVRKKGDGAN